MTIVLIILSCARPLCLLSPTVKTEESWASSLGNTCLLLGVEPHTASAPATVLFLARSQQLKSWVCSSGAKFVPGYRNGCKSWKWKNRDGSAGTSRGPDSHLFVGGNKSHFHFLWGIPTFYGGTPASVVKLITLFGPHLRNESHCGNEKGGETFGRTFETDVGGLGGRNRSCGR